MKQVKRVSKKDFETEVEDKITEGYKVESKTDRQAVLVKRNVGGVVGHVVVLVLTGWWTFLLGNIVYAGYCYFAKADEVVIKIKK